MKVGDAADSTLLADGIIVGIAHPFQGALLLPRQQRPVQLRFAGGDIFAFGVLEEAAVGRKEGIETPPLEWVPFFFFALMVDVGAGRRRWMQQQHRSCHRQEADDESASSLVLTPSSTVVVVVVVVVVVPGGILHF